MDNNFDNLKKLLDSIKEFGFWNRIFNWKKIKNLLLEAKADFQKLISNVDNLREINTKQETSISGLSKDLQLIRDENTKLNLSSEKLNESFRELSDKVSQQKEEIATIKQNNSDLVKRVGEKDIENNQLKKDIVNLQNQISELKKANTELTKDDETRQKEHSKSLETLNKIQNQIQSDRNKEVEQKSQSEIERLNKLKETWGKHEVTVQNAIKTICSKHTVDYIEKVPFKGEPDNTLKICDEFVVFDAKSPAGDDMSNFSSYLKDQAEKAKKYAKQENVKLDIYFVVPSNTLEVINQFVFNLADYNVFIISIDSLEPVILSLQKIEEYEFAEQLTPEERDGICRILGKFAHLSKRRIQIDSFFAKQFIELAYKSEADLPKEIFEKVVEFEKAEKLNPPIERRAKAISTKELENDTNKLSNDVNSRGINTEDSTISIVMNELPLYKKEEEN